MTYDCEFTCLKMVLKIMRVYMLTARGGSRRFADGSQRFAAVRDGSPTVRGGSRTVRDGSRRFANGSRRFANGSWRFANGSRRFAAVRDGSPTVRGGSRRFATVRTITHRRAPLAYTLSLASSGSMACCIFDCLILTVFVRFFKLLWSVTVLWSALCPAGAVTVRLIFR